MSEVGTISKSMSPKMLGALAPGCEAKILGDNGEILGKDEVGEILAKTPTIMKGEMEIKVTRKYPLRGYFLGVLAHTTAWDRLWGGDENM